MFIEFTVPGEPVAKGRARAFIRAGKINHYTPPKTVAYEKLVRLYATQAMHGRQPLTGPVALTVTAYFSIPNSWSLKKQREAKHGIIHHTKTPDLDNSIKSVQDAINGIIWVDDCQVIQIQASKRYARDPLVLVTVESMLFSGAKSMLFSGAKSMLFQEDQK